MRYLAFAILFIVPCSALLAGTLMVPEHFSTIQGALNASVSGDIISVAPGTYHENILFVTGGVILKSRVLHAATIRGVGSGHVIEMVNLSGAVEGFVITGSGKNDSGVILYESSQTIRNNIIKGNDYGIWTYWYATPLIDGNRIENNVQAGITMFTDASAKVVNNIISGNGLGVWVSSGGADVKIINNTFIQNMHNLEIWSTKAEVANNIIAKGDIGIYFYDSTYDPDITQYVGQYLTINHNDVWNQAKHGYFGELGIPPYNYTKGPFTPLPGTGEIHLDPAFVDEGSGDLHILYTSPCRESGDQTVLGLPGTDFEGDPRIAFGTVDMGVDEFFTHLYWTGDGTPGGNVEIKFTGLPGTVPVGFCIGTGILDPPIPSMWGDWFLQFPIIGPIDLGQIPSPDGVLAISGMIPLAPPAPYTIPMQALIGGELTNMSVMVIN